jgi:D-glycero-D-manno-heptose 1,7-bisphosphate phosphatase
MSPRRGVFCDRDGTIIAERDYLADPAEVELIPGTAEGLAALREAGFALVIVTNQSGIARGYYSEEDYAAVAARVEQLLARGGAPVDAVQYCPHHPDVSGPCPCRKPATGMYRTAAQALGIDLGESYYVGDKISDVIPALELGGHGVLVRTGYGADPEGDLPEGVTVVDDLQAAARFILADSGR